MRKALVGVAVFVFLLPTQANADWYPIGSDTGKSKWFMDPSRIKLVGGKAQAWVRIDASGDRSVKWSEAKMLISFDCAADTSKTISDIKYDTYGKVVSSTSTPDYGYGYSPVIPDSIGETIEKLACMVK